MLNYIHGRKINKEQRIKGGRKESRERKKVRSFLAAPSPNQATTALCKTSVVRISFPFTLVIERARRYPEQQSRQNPHDNRSSRERRRQHPEGRYGSAPTPTGRKKLVQLTALNGKGNRGIIFTIASKAPSICFGFFDAGKVDEEKWVSQAQFYRR